MSYRDLEVVKTCVQCGKERLIRKDESICRECISSSSISEKELAALSVVRGDTQQPDDIAFILLD